MLRLFYPDVVHRFITHLLYGHCFERSERLEIKCQLRYNGSVLRSSIIYDVVSQQLFSQLIFEILVNDSEDTVDLLSRQYLRNCLVKLHKMTRNIPKTLRWNRWTRIPVS